MAAKMTVVYQTLEDKKAFDKHYFNIHIPLAKKLPGLIKYEINEGSVVSPNGHSNVYLIAHLYFRSMDAIKTAFASDIGKLCAADRRKFAPDDEKVAMYLYETKEV